MTDIGGDVFLPSNEAILEVHIREHGVLRAIGQGVMDGGVGTHVGGDVLEGDFQGRGLKNQTILSMQVLGGDLHEPIPIHSPHMIVVPDLSRSSQRIIPQQPALLQHGLLH